MGAPAWPWHGPGTAPARLQRGAHTLLATGLSSGRGTERGSSHQHCRRASGLAAWEAGEPGIPSAAGEMGLGTGVGAGNRSRCGEPVLRTGAGALIQSWCWEPELLPGPRAGADNWSWYQELELVPGARASGNQSRCQEPEPVPAKGAGAENRRVCSPAVHAWVWTQVDTRVPGPGWLQARPGAGTAVCTAQEHPCAHTRTGGAWGLQRPPVPPPHPVAGAASHGTAPPTPSPTVCLIGAIECQTPATPAQPHPPLGAQRPPRTPDRGGMRTPRDPTPGQCNVAPAAPRSGPSPGSTGPSVPPVAPAVTGPRLKPPYPLSLRPYRGCRSLRPSGSGAGAAALAAVMCRCRHGRRERIPRPEPDKGPF